ncbi:MAG TPA: MarR family transcriptional regulator [Gaiellaceae bacterium]|jgi:DNA-binding MarR family transcriptional regulator|nr:MarR family transcriptional regulator [Gaiellaceae bacterium]
MSSARRHAANGIHSAAIHLLRRVRVEDEAMGITPARASALSVLVFGGARSLTELAAAEQVTPATMSRLVSALEREKLVRRYPDVDDARSIRLEATAKAERILKRGQARRLDLLERLLADASEAEVMALRTAAEVVERALESA